MVKSISHINRFVLYLILFAIIFACKSNTPQNPQKTYDNIKTEVEYKRDSICKEYSSASENKKDSIIAATKQYLFQTIVMDILPAWHGTKWDFNGITEEPQNGEIACGMFVTIVLKDAGFNISRIKSGQLASETLIKKLSTDIKRFSNSKMEKVISYLKNKDDGLYIVGLDMHIGFVVKENDNLKFVHSNYYSPHIKVMSQQLTETSPLTDSGYRIFGKNFGR